MKRRWLIGAVLGFVGVTALSAWPLAWSPLAFLKNDNGLQPHMEGTIWRGTVSGLPNIDKLHITSSLKPVLKGTPPVTFRADQPALNMRGQVGLGRLENVEARGWLSWILPLDPRFKGISGRYDLALDVIKLDLGEIEAGCTQAQGQFSTDVLQQNAALWNWSGPKLSGPITCEDGDIIVHLFGRDSQQVINIAARLLADGRYNTVFEIETSQAGASALLLLYGFEATNTGFRLNEQGRWR